MHSIYYDEIYSRFLARVQAYDLTETVTEECAIEMMDEWLISVKSNPRVRNLFSTIALSLDENEKKIINYELKNTIDEESDYDFVKEIFSLGMSWKWAEPKYKSILNASMYIGGKEATFFSQANHMSQVKNMYESSRSELYRIISDRGYYNNSYLGNNNA